MLPFIACLGAGWTNSTPHLWEAAAPPEVCEEESGLIIAGFVALVSVSYTKERIGIDTLEWLPRMGPGSGNKGE